MNKVQQEWENLRLAYQQRYVKYAKQVNENPDNKTVLGQMLESSYVLINVFGLSSEQVQELESYDYCGLTNQDIMDTF